jgi:hypothetical protein
VTYNSVLPEVFQYNVVVNDQQARMIAVALIAPGVITSKGIPTGNATNGSSFAITVDTETGQKKLWLSATSLARLEQMPEWNVAFGL